MIPAGCINRNESGTPEGGSAADWCDPERQVPQKFWPVFRLTSKDVFASRGWGRGSGFTLTELLVAVAIIGMLAGMALGVYSAVREQARVARTRATVAKIHRLLMERYESFLTRRVPVSAVGLPPRVAALERLLAIRELMRVEMPQSFRDMIAAAPVHSPLQEAYRRRYSQMRPSPENQSAECLFLILTTGPDSARDQFADYEIGDTDGDGWPEFIDGWGRPIRFLRWAPCLIDSDIQPRVVDATGTFNVDLAIEAVKHNYDPFDPWKVDYSLAREGEPNYPPRSWYLIPIVYSAGADGEYGIRDIEYVYASEGSQAVELNWTGPSNPFYFQQGTSRQLNRLGAPVGSGWVDNIHNHRLGQGQ